METESLSTALSDTNAISAMSGSPTEDDSAVFQRSKETVSLYLSRALPSLLGNCNDDDFEIVKKVIDDSSESIMRFVSDGQYPALVCERICGGKDEQDDSSASGVLPFEYRIGNEIHYGGSRALSVVFLKRGIQTLDTDKQSLLSQLIICSMPENGNAYASVQSLSSNLCLPYFKSYVNASSLKQQQQQTQGEMAGDKMTKNVEKRFADLDTLLVHLQQNIDIPQISLAIHPYVSSVVKSYQKSQQNSDETYRRKPSVDDFGDKLEDSTFLNQLQAGVNRWIRDIRQVTKLDRDPASGSSLQEVNFWLNLENELNRIQTIRDSLEVQLTLDILKTGKRFHAVVSFDSDTGLKQTLEKVRDYNVLMKDFPINDLLSSTDIDSILAAVKVVFNGLKKIRNTKYPVSRVIRFIDAMSKDLSNQMLKVLANTKLIQMDYEDCNKLLNHCLNVFTAWDDEYSKFQGVSRDVLRKKRTVGSGASPSAAGANVASWRLTLSHQQLQNRLTRLKKFRHQHEQLLNVIARVLTCSNKSGSTSSAEVGVVLDPSITAGGNNDEIGDQSNPIDEVRAAYDVVRNVDVLDLSKESTTAWENAIKAYESKIDKVERTIASRLRSQLTSARSANEMFRIFSRFNALFVRPHIRGAISEYQSRLIEHVKVDIENLQKMFQDSYGDSGTCRVLKSRDFPPVSGYSIWVKQIERQLDLYLKRVEDVIGRGWEAHIEGAKLKEEGDAFRERLSTQPIFEDWKQRVMQRGVSISGFIFTVEAVRKKASESIYRLKANFTLEAINLSKECRHFRVLGFRIPVSISNKAQDINNLYPYAIALNDGVQSLNWCSERLAEAGICETDLTNFDDDSHCDTIDLLAQSRNDLNQLIQEGLVIPWDSYKLETYAYSFADTVFQHQVKVEEVLKMQQKIDSKLIDLEKCRFAKDTISKILDEIQLEIENITRRAFSNIDHFVRSLDQRIEGLLLGKLIKAIELWAKALASLNAPLDISLPSTSTVKNSITNNDHDENSRNNQSLDCLPLIEKSNHELWIINQLLLVKPPIEKARNNLLKQLSQYQSIVLLQKRIRPASSSISNAQQHQHQQSLSEYSTTYKSLFRRVSHSPDGLIALGRSYAEINNFVNTAVKYVDNWLHFQSLWDLQAETLYERLGDDVHRWVKCIKQIREARKTFDTQETCIVIGPIKIQYGRVQSKVSLKYDSWHQDVVNRFGQMLGNEMRSFYEHIMSIRLIHSLSTIHRERRYPIFLLKKCCFNKMCTKFYSFFALINPNVFKLSILFSFLFTT